MIECGHLKSTFSHLIFAILIREMREYRAPGSPLLAGGATTISPTTGGGTVSFALYRKRVFEYDNLGRLVK